MVNFNEDHRGGTCCLSKAGLAIGSTATEISTAAPNGAGIDFAIAGVAYHKVDDATATLTVHPVQAINTKCIYLICSDFEGTISSVKGIEVTTAKLTSGEEQLQFPKPLASTCPIGYFTMATVDVTFTTGTDNLTKSGCTAAYVDLFRLPSAPLTA